MRIKISVTKEYLLQIEFQQAHFNAVSCEIGVSRMVDEMIDRMVTFWIYRNVEKNMLLPNLTLTNSLMILYLQLWHFRLINVKSYSSVDSC